MYYIKIKFFIFMKVFGEKKKNTKKYDINKKLFPYPYKKQKKLIKNL